MSNTNTQQSKLIKKVIKIGSINIGGMSDRSNFCLNKYIEDEGFDVLTVQELRGAVGELNPTHLPLDNMNYIIDTNNAVNKGAAIYAHHNISLTKLEAISKMSTNIDSCWGLILAHGKRYIIGSVYAKLDYNSAIPEILEMLKNAEKMQQKLKATGIILTGDFNARHRSWGDTINCSNGKKLVEYLDHSSYSICTSTTPTFLCVNNGGSFIDLAIISNRLVDSVSKCETNSDVELFSGAPKRGHVPLITELIVHEKKNNNINIKLDPSTTNWQEWTSHIELTINDRLNILESEDDPYKLWNQLNGIFTEATNLHCGIKKSCSHSKPFWSQTLTLLSNQLKAARKSYVKRNTPRNLENLNKAREAFDNERKSSCKDFLIKKVKNLNSAQSQYFWKEFNKLFNKKTQHHIDPLEDGEGGLLTETKDLDDCLFSAFFEGKHLKEGSFDEKFHERVNDLYEKVMKEESYPSPDETDYSHVEALNAPITAEETIKAFKKIKGKSVDNLNMHPKMLLNLGPKALNIIQRLFNLCLTSHEWVWDSAEVVFLKKDGKESYSKAGSYRPICITAYIGKRMEDIIATRIEVWLLEMGKDDPDQEGFTSKKNTIRYLSRLHLGIEKDIESNLTILCLFIDFEKAFDSVWKQGLIVKLKELGIKGHILKLLNNFLFSRNITLNINGTKGNKRQGSNYGLPQGSVLSPVLFKIFLMDFVADLKNRDDICILKFADDGTIKVTAETSEECVQKLNNILEHLLNWTRKWRMKVNCDKNKTEVICFHTKENNKNLIPTSFSLGNKEILRVSSTKVLGLTMDEDLTYEKHCDNVLKSIQTTWVNLCKYSNRHWGFKQDVMLYLVKTLILSKIHYASHIYATTRNFQQIIKFWYHILKSVTGAVLNPRQNIIEVVLGVPPLHIQTKINSVKHILKLNIKPLNSDRYRDFIQISYNEVDKSPKCLYNKLKTTFDFLLWKLRFYPSHFCQNDAYIINEKLFGEFFNLQEKACSYNKQIVNRYTDEVLWKASLNNQYLLEGYPCSPNPSSNALPIPNDTSRKTEVLLMNIFFKNNILKDSLYRIGKVNSPLCTLCGLTEETAEHILFNCTFISEDLRLRAQQSYTNTVNTPTDYPTGFLAVSRNTQFISSCVKILKDLPLCENVSL